MGIGHSLKRLRTKLCLSVLWKSLATLERVSEGLIPPGKGALWMRVAAHVSQVILSASPPGLGAWTCSNPLPCTQPRLFSRHEAWHTARPASYRLPSAKVQTCCPITQHQSTSEEAPPSLSFSDPSNHPVYRSRHEVGGQCRHGTLLVHRFPCVRELHGWVACDNTVIESGNSSHAAECTVRVKHDLIHLQAQQQSGLRSQNERHVTEGMKQMELGRLHVQHKHCAQSLQDTRKVQCTQTSPRRPAAINPLQFHSAASPAALLPPIHTIPKFPWCHSACNSAAEAVGGAHLVPQ
jgi:hypothetical protein